MSDGKVFIGKYSDIDIWISKVNTRTVTNYGTFNQQYIGTKNLYLTAEQVQQLKDDGYLNDTQLSNIDRIESEWTSEAGTTQTYIYQIRWYEKEVGIFPKIIQVFRLSCGQPAVNFPALTAKWIYENYTSHIEQDEPLHIYDSSAGWGGRIIGAMSSRKKTHYIGTDPNPDNFIDDLGITRYQYVADFYNKNCVDDFSDKLTSFFDVKPQSNTFEVFQDGSELIHNNPEFQK